MFPAPPSIAGMPELDEAGMTGLTSPGIALAPARSRHPVAVAGYAALCRWPRTRSTELISSETVVR